VSEDSSRAAWLRQARSYLRHVHADPVLARLIDDRPDFDPRAWWAQLPPMDLYGALLFQVTGQQLSVPATRRTLARIQALFGGHLPAPAELLGAEAGQLREAGLSWRKISTLHDLAGRVSDGRLDPDVLSRLPDDELMAELTAIPGIGPWTVQGALIIALGREDVVLPGDLALRKAVQAAYSWNTCPPRRRSWPSRRNGGPTAAWRPATCSPPPSNRPRHHRSPDSGALDHERRLHASRPDPRCRAPRPGVARTAWAQGRRDWVHLPVCQECGHVGCCDNSPGRPATAHFRLAGHPVIRSYEPGEDRYWRYLDQSATELQGAPPAPSRT
jgi:DNA-3-methyladenine glycosylase II